MTLPPEQQCTMPGCDEEAVDPGKRGSVCRFHLPDGSDGETVTQPQEERTERPSEEAGQCSDTSDGIEHEVYPADLVDVDQWLAWKETEDGRKVPRAPWTGGDPATFVSAQDPEVWTDLETVQEWCAKLPGFEPAFNIRDRNEHPDERFVLIDYDDARDPETGAIHPVVREHIERAESYADVSTSGTGVHIFCRGALPDDVKAIEATLPEAEGFEGAEIEVYDSARYSAMTGDHLAGTPTETTDCQAFLEDLAEEFATVAEGTPDELLREPETPKADLAEVETTDDIQDVLDAIQHTSPRDIRLRSTVTHERGDGSKSLDPAWAHSESGTRLAQVGDGWVYRKGMVGLDALQVVALEERIIHDETEYPSGETFWRAVDALRDRGAHVPEYEPPGGDGGGGRFPIQECEPPVEEASEADVDEIRTELAGDLLDEVVEDDKLHLWTHDPGTGKTTTPDIELIDRDERSALYSPTHEKSRDHATDDVTPDSADYFHLKGAEQPLHDCCLDAKSNARHDETPECPEHGHPSGWPRMCPVYERGGDDPVRQVFDQLVPEVGVERAHRILDLCESDGPSWHPEECAWQTQYDEVENHDHVLAVHPYATQKTVHEGRLNIIDEAAGIEGEERRLTVDQLTRVANTLERIADLRPRDDPVGYTTRRLAGFARDVVDVVTDPDAPDELSALEAPEAVWNAYETYNDAAGHHVAREAPDEPWQRAEAFAKAKVALGETVLRRMQRDEWEGTPLSIDPLLAAAAVAGDGDEIERAAMQAIALPAVLEECPWCGSQLDAHNGARHCSTDACDWDERERTLTQRDGERARALAWIETDVDDAPTGLAYRSKPLASELPDPSNTLVLDATGDREAVAARFDVDVDDVQVSGDEPMALPNARVVQVADGQYHKSTLEDSATARERCQASIDTAGDVYEHPLFAVEKRLLDAGLFEFPENATVRHYHALRGLNLDDCDAVMCIGAPHPDVDDLRREAKLLAMGRDDLRVGGAEHSTRRGDDGEIAANPPVYRKLNYVDEDGRGRAVPTKHYTGLVGALFRESREQELVQAAHRPRPLLADADEPVDVYLLTNVPTSLHVDELVGFDELADPLEAFLPVPDGAVELLEAVQEAVDGEIDGFRAGQLVEQRDDGAIANKVAGYHRLAQLAGVSPRGADGPPSRRTIYSWVNALEDVGLLRPEEYEQRDGVAYAADLATLQSALSVLSGNGGFKVAAVRRFRRLAGRADGSLDWLEWARSALNLGGDRCGWDPPPDRRDLRPN